MIPADYHNAARENPEDEQTSQTILALAKLLRDLVSLRFCQMTKNNNLLRKVAIPSVMMSLVLAAILLSAAAAAPPTDATKPHSFRLAATDDWLWNQASRIVAILLDILTLFGGLIVIVLALGGKSQVVEGLEMDVANLKVQQTNNCLMLACLEGANDEQIVWNKKKEELLLNHRSKILGLLQSTVSMHADLTTIEDEVLRMTTDYRLMARQLQFQARDMYLDAVTFGVPIVRRTAAQILMSSYSVYTTGPIDPDNTVQLRFSEYGPNSAATAKQLKLEEEEFKHKAQDIVNEHLDLSYFKGGLTREQIGRVQDLMERHPHIAKECPVEAWIVNSQDSTRNFVNAY